MFGQGTKSPIWESGELKFNKGKEFIRLADMEFEYEYIYEQGHWSVSVYANSSVTINMWIKLKEAPESSAYILRCQNLEDMVKI